MPIKWNDAESARERSDSKPLNLKDEKKCIDIINDSLSKNNSLSQCQIELLQKFVNNYQHMEYLCVINGLV